ncbi:MAG TPA: hypothetical protein VH594_23215 [Trebonia sp.]
MARRSVTASARVSRPCLTRLSTLLEIVGGWRRASSASWPSEVTPRPTRSRMRYCCTDSGVLRPSIVSA